MKKIPNINSFIIDDSILLVHLFQMEEVPTLRNQFAFWNRVYRDAKKQKIEMDTACKWSYSLNILTGELTFKKV